MGLNLACTLIVGDTESSKVENVIKSIEPYFDYLYVGYNGSSDSWPYYTPSSCEFVYKKFEWVEDFSVSRNQVFDLAYDSGIEHDWLFWIDSDDTLIKGDNIQTLLASVPKSITHVMLPYNYVIDHKGRPSKVHYRERFIRFIPEQRFKWVNSIHEINHPPSPATIHKSSLVAVNHDVVVSQVIDSDPAYQKKRDRNRKSLSEDMRKYVAGESSSPMPLFYYALEIMQSASSMGNVTHPGRLNDACKLFDEFCTKNVSPDHVYMANYYKAICLQLLHNLEASSDAALQCVKIYPYWPEAYTLLMDNASTMSDWKSLKYYCDQILSFSEDAISNRDTEQVADITTIYTKTYFYLSQYYLSVKDLQRALNYAKESLDYDPSNEQSINLVKDIEDKIENGYEFPDDCRKRLFGTSPDKSICFFVPPTAEAWHPSLIDGSGSGGAEHCVVEIAKRFAADGYRTVIFGTPGKFGGFDEATGIEFYNCQDFVPSERFDIFVTSRYPHVLDATLNCRKKILWLHDVHSGVDSALKPDGTNRFDQADHVICLTEWHENFTKDLYGCSNTTIVPNGVNIESLKGADLGRPLGNKFVYASSPDRGLGFLLDYWPEIMDVSKELGKPAPELHIYYGWMAIDKMIRLGQRHLAYLKHVITEKISKLGGEDVGIFWHDRVPRSELHKQLPEYDFWGYPTTFCETFCITAVEQQLAGVIPLTSSLAALNDVVSPANELIQGWASNDSYKSEWLAVYRKLLSSDHSDIVSIRMHQRDFASKFTWDASYIKWKELCDES